MCVSLGIRHQSSRPRKVIQHSISLSSPPDIAWAPAAPADTDATNSTCTGDMCCYYSYSTTAIAATDATAAVDAITAIDATTATTATTVIDATVATTTSERIRPPL